MTSLVESLLCKKKKTSCPFFLNRESKKKIPFSSVIVCKCAHSPAVCHSAAGLTGHASQAYNRVPLPATMVRMAGVKGQLPLPNPTNTHTRTPNSGRCPPPPVSLPQSLCRKDLSPLFFSRPGLLCTQCSSPGAAAFHRPLLESSRHQMSH